MHSMRVTVKNKMSFFVINLMGQCYFVMKVNIFSYMLLFIDDFLSQIADISFNNEKSFPHYTVKMQLSRK